jgi:NTE family protein
MLSLSKVVAYDKPEGGSGGPDSARRRPVVGLALGAGAARGWAHIGIIHELTERGFTPDIIAGTSIGAVVGGCHAAGKLSELEGFARSLSRRSVFGMLDLSLSGAGLIAGGRLRSRLEANLAEQRIEDLTTRFAAVATEVGSGHEVWLTRGRLCDAIRASYALPGIFEPVRLGGRFLFDGALVNPVPVTVCRALGADLVIAVNIIGDTLFRGTVVGDAPVAEIEAALELPVPHPPGLRQRAASLFRRHDSGAPGIASVMMDAFNITQDRIARSRLAGDPPDVLIKARLDGVGLFDFHRAADLIDMGREAARRALPDIAEHVALTPVGQQAAI